MGIFDFFKGSSENQMNKCKKCGGLIDKRFEICSECNEMLNAVEEEEKGNIILDEILSVTKVNEKVKEMLNAVKEEEKRKRMKPLDEIPPLLEEIFQDRALRFAREIIILNEKKENRTEEEAHRARMKDHNLRIDIERWLRKLEGIAGLPNRSQFNYLSDPFHKAVINKLNKFLFENGEKEKKVNILKIHYCKRLFNDIVKEKGIPIEDDEVTDMCFEDFELKILQDLKKYEKKLKKDHSTKGMELPIFLIREIWKNETFLHKKK